MTIRLEPIVGLVGRIWSTLVRMPPSVLMIRTWIHEREGVEPGIRMENVSVQQGRLQGLHAHINAPSQPPENKKLTSATVI